MFVLHQFLLDMIGGCDIVFVLSWVTVQCVALGSVISVWHTFNDVVFIILLYYMMTVVICMCYLLGLMCCRVPSGSESASLCKMNHSLLSHRATLQKNCENITEYQLFEINPWNLFSNVSRAHTQLAISCLAKCLVSILYSNYYSVRIYPYMYLFMCYGQYGVTKEVERGVTY